MDNPEKYRHGEITNRIIQGFYQVFNQIGFGFDKNIYVNSLAIALKKLEIEIRKNQSLEVEFNGEVVGQMKVDLIADEKVLIQVFAEKEMSEFDEQKSYNQIKASGLNVGLILNFGINPQFKRKEII